MCTETDYATPGMEQAFPDMGAWTSTDAACAKKFQDTGGYGEMSVTEQSVLCEAVDDGGKPLVFNRVRYCETKCSSQPTLPECQACAQGGSGQF